MIAPVYQPSQNCPQSKLRRARLGPSELNLPVTPEDQALIDRAVSASGLTRTDFGLQAARLAAQELLIEQTEVGAFYWTDCALDIVNPGREELGSTSV